MGWLSNDLKPDRTQPKGLIVNTRILWAFSAAYRVTADPVYAEMAARAFDFVTNKFWDAQHGGAFWRLNDAGKVIDDSKKIYGQALGLWVQVVQVRQDHQHDRQDQHRHDYPSNPLHLARPLAPLLPCHQALLVAPAGRSRTASGSGTN